MNLAKVAPNRQITVPMDICRYLHIKPGDKLLFVEKGNGEVVISNASSTALNEIQKSFRGVAETLGVKNEDDVMELVREIRYEELS